LNCDVNARKLTCERNVEDYRIFGLLLKKEKERVTIFTFSLHVSFACPKDTVLGVIQGVA